MNFFKLIAVLSVFIYFSLVQAKNEAGEETKIREIREIREYTELPLEGSPLINAVRTADLEEIERLLNQGVDVNKISMYGVPPLHWAVFHGYPDIVQRLVQAGADIEARDDDHWTASEWAAAKNDRIIMDLLIVGPPLVRAVRKDDLEETESLLNQEDMDVNRGDKYGYTALHWAARNGDSFFVQRLLQAGADIEAKDSYGWTALQWAAAEGHDIIADILVSKGADINTRDHLNYTPLHWAIENDRHIELVNQLILAGASLEAKNNYGETPLWKACFRGSTKTMNSLISAGADIYTRKNGRSLMREALYRDIGHSYKIAPPRVSYRLCIDALFSAGIDLTNDVNPNTGQNLLHFVIVLKYDDIPLVTALLNAGVDVNGRDHNEETPLHYLYRYRQEYLGNFLISRGADVRAKNNYGSRPVRWDRTTNQFKFYRDGTETLWENFVYSWTHPQQL